MRHIIRARDFRDEGDKSMIKKLKKRSRMKEGMDSIKHISFNNLPIMLKKESKETIKARGFLWTQLKNSVLNLKISYRSVQF